MDKFFSHNQVDVLVLAGGTGHKLSPLCYSQAYPKPMLHLVNRPLIWHSIAPLYEIGFRSFYVFCPAKHVKTLQKYIESQFSNTTVRPLPAEDDVLSQGSAAALREYKRDVIAQMISGTILHQRDVLCVSTDTVTNVDYTKLIASFYSSFASAVVLAAPELPEVAERREQAAKNERDSKPDVLAGGDSTNIQDVIGYDAVEAGSPLLTDGLCVRRLQHLAYAESKETAPAALSVGYLSRRPRMTLTTHYKTVHIYMLRPWLVDYACQRPDIYSISTDLLPELVKKQYAVLNEDRTLEMPTQRLFDPSVLVQPPTLEVSKGPHGAELGSSVSPSPAGSGPPSAGPSPVLTSMDGSLTTNVSNYYATSIPAHWISEPRIAALSSVRSVPSESDELRVFVVFPDPALEPAAPAESAADAQKKKGKKGGGKTQGDQGSASISVHLQQVPSFFAQRVTHLLHYAVLSKLMLPPIPQNADQFQQVLTVAAAGRRYSHTPLASIMLNEVISDYVMIRTRGGESGKLYANNSAVADGISLPEGWWKADNTTDNATPGAMLPCKNSVVGRKCTFGKGVRVTNSVILVGAVLEDDVIITDSIIGAGAVIKARAHVSNCVVGCSSVVDGAKHYAHQALANTSGSWGKGGAESVGFL